MNLQAWIVVSVIVVAFIALWRYWMCQEQRLMACLLDLAALTKAGHSEIDTMTDDGWCLACGPHREGLTGYFAQFYRPVGSFRDTLMTLVETDWADAGHGDTLAEAILMAADIALGRKVIVPHSEDFLP